MKSLYCLCYNDLTIIFIFREWGIFTIKRPVLFSSCSGPYRKSQIYFILDGILINAAIILTTGVFMSGYMIHLGASDFLIGIINNAPSWALIISVFSSVIYERMEYRKNLLITLDVMSRIFICSIVFLPLIFKNTKIAVMLAANMVIIGNILWGIYSTGVTVWMFSLVHAKKRANYIYARMFYLRISFTITTILMGTLLDRFNKNYVGFLTVFMVSLILSLIDAILLSRTEEPPNRVNKEHTIKFSQFLSPLKDAEYSKFLLFVFLFFLSLTISSSFTSLYHIRYLKLSYSFISFVNVLNYIAMIACTKFWGRVEEKKGIQFVLGITGIIVLFEFFIYNFLTTKTYFLLFLSSVIAGIGNSGFNISIVTYRYDLIPESNKTLYEGWYGAAHGISTILGPIIGNKIMNSLPRIQNAVYEYSNFQLLYLISFIMGITVFAFMFYIPKKINYTWNYTKNYKKD